MTAEPAAPPTELAAPPTLGSGAMFDRIAPRYDLVNRVLSFGLDRGWRRRTVRALDLGERPRVLDVATGTGDLAIELARARPLGEVIGLDPSPGMLALARTKLDRLGLGSRVTLIEGDAQQLPLASCEVDAATIAFGIRNVPDRPKALRELARVVRPGGKIAVLELADPQPRKGPLAAMARFHTHYFVPKLGALLSGKREYAYLQKSVAAFPSAEAFAAIMRDSGLRVIEVVPMTFGVCTMYLATPAEDP